MPSDETEGTTHGEVHDDLPSGSDRLTSVGIDIGTSTSHLMFAELTIGHRTPHSRKPEVLDRVVVNRSPVLLTPFDADWNIDSAAVGDFVEAAFRSAGIARERIDTGAIIITGEAARKDNARQVVELFSGQIGRFVCATAGPHLETVLAAHGSGAVSRSRDCDQPVLNIDIGGGTTKLSIIRAGRIEAVMAVNIGARLLTFDAERRIRRIEKDGRRFLDAIGCRHGEGDVMEAREIGRLATRMAETLFAVLAGSPAPWPEFFVTPYFGPLPDLGGIVFSGGVSEYIYGREKRQFGDLGLWLAAEVASEAKHRRHRILPASEGIRATVIGASQYTVQVTGETIAVPGGVELPLRNLQIAVVPVDWEAPIGERAAHAIAAGLAARDAEVRGQPFALLIAAPRFSGYGAVMEMGRGVGAAIKALAPADRPVALIFQDNVGQLVGRVLAEQALEMLCIDEINLTELDFIDIGAIVAGQNYLPVVVKSLVFDV